MSSTTGRTLTDAEKSRIERNRQKALYLRQAKLIPRTIDGDSTLIKVHGTRFKDSGGGFLIEESQNTALDDAPEEPPEIIHTEATHPIHYEECLECEEKFMDSDLMKNFSYPVCDICRDPDNKHSLITKTEAKAEYLLQDCDLDKRPPPLKFILKKNPHNQRWGEMKLYLHVQVEKRALEVWGSEEKLREQHEARDSKREKTKAKMYNKKIKALRMDMRSTLYDRTTKANHVHAFGPDTYNEADDNYTHTCLTCPYSETFEKM